MEQPKDFPKALAVLTVAEVVVFTVAAVVGVSKVCVKGLRIHSLTLVIDPVPLQWTVRNCAPDRIATGAVHAEVRLRVRHGTDGHHW